MRATVYMGTRDMQRQALNVFRMEMLGAEVVPVHSGSRTLKDACSAAMRGWVGSVQDTHYCVGSVMDLTRTRGWSASSSASSAMRRGHSWPASFRAGTPDYVVACVGGGSNAAGTFAGFVDTPAQLIGVEADGGASMAYGRVWALHGFRSKVLQDDDGQIAEAHSMAAGLDYPGIGPEHAFLGDIGRARYVTVADEEVVVALKRLAQAEGILCALESAHAVAWVLRAAGTRADARPDRQ